MEGTPVGAGGGGKEGSGAQMIWGGEAVRRDCHHW